MMNKTINGLKVFLSRFWKVFAAFAVYILAQIPSVLAGDSRKNDFRLYVIFTIIGIICSLGSIYFAWHYLVKGDSKVQTPFFKKITSKQKVIIFVTLLVIMVLSGFVEDLIPTPDNELELLKSFKADPFGIVISTNIFAPINEELIFRSGIQKQFFAKMDQKRQVVLFVIVSSLIFGLLHEPRFDLQLLPYVFMGVIFSLAYVLLKDVKYDMSLHIINNVISTIGDFI